jgi:hypothetical protein
MVMRGIVPIRPETPALPKDAITVLPPATGIQEEKP